MHCSDSSAHIGKQITQMDQQWNERSLNLPLLFFPLYSQINMFQTGLLMWKVKTSFQIVYQLEEKIWNRWGKISSAIKSNKQSGSSWGQKFFLIQLGNLSQWIISQCFNPFPGEKSVWHQDMTIKEFAKTSRNLNIFSILIISMNFQNFATRIELFLFTTKRNLLLTSEVGCSIIPFTSRPTKAVSK